MEPQPKSSVPSRAAFTCRVLAGVVGLVGLWCAARYPLGTVWGIAVYAIAVVAVATTSNFWLALLPVAYSVGDLYPWTGSLLISEADLFCAAALAVLLWRKYGDALEAARERRFIVLWTPLLVCVGIGLVRGWYRLPAALSGDQLSLYGNEWNAVRIAKGYFWGVAFAPFMIAQLRREPTSFRRFIGGVQASAAVVGLAVIWERHVTVGLLNFHDLYRPSGPMFSSHIGGLQIDAFWAIALPLLLMPPARGGNPVVWLYHFALLAASYYAIGATMSRGLIALAACETFAMLAAIVVGAWCRRHRVSWRAAMTIVVLVCVAFGSIVLFVTSAPMQARLRYVDADWHSRWERWTGLCHAASSDWAGDAIGNGAGVLPSMLSDLDGGPPRPAELISGPDSQPTLRLRPGKSVFVDQLVDPNAPSPWQLSAHISQKGTAQLTVHVSEKTLYRSFGCVEATLMSPPAQSPKQSRTVPLDVRPLESKSRAFFRRPVTFALSASGTNGWVDVAGLRLEDARGRQLLNNQDFRAGSARWFFTSGDLAAWRADNVWVQLYVEHGALGTLSFTWLALGTMVPLIYNAATRRDFGAYALSLAIAGFLAIGIVGTLIDTPSLTALFLALLAVGQALVGRAESTSFRR